MSSFMNSVRVFYLQQYLVKIEVERWKHLLSQVKSDQYNS